LPSYGLLRSVWHRRLGRRQRSQRRRPWACNHVMYAVVAAPVAVHWLQELEDLRYRGPVRVVEALGARLLGAEAVGARLRGSEAADALLYGADVHE